MNLVINVDALDKSEAAVNSASDRTAVEQLEKLVFGDDEPLTVSFCDDAGATPSWVTDSDVGVSVGLGIPDVGGAQVLAQAEPLTIDGATRVGVLPLTGTPLQQALQQACDCRRGRWLTLEIRKTDENGLLETLALLNVFVALGVLAP